MSSNQVVNKGGRPQNQEIDLNNFQTQVLIGTLFGDAYITPPSLSSANANAHLNFQHSLAQEAYTIWKADILGMKTFYRDQYDSRTDKTYHSISAYSQCSPTYTELYHRIYGEDGFKRLDQSLLYEMGPVSLATWVQDDGCLHTSGRNIRLHTERFTYRENVLIKRYFEEVWGLSPNIQKKRSQGGMKYILNFPVEDTFKLVDIIKPYIQPELQYKITLKPYKQPPQWYKDIISNNNKEVN